MTHQPHVPTHRHLHRLTAVILVACVVISGALLAAMHVSGSDEPARAPIDGPQATVTLLATHRG